jgi:hypothetical protein
MNMYFDKSVEDQILMTIHNLLNRSVWDDEVIMN